MKELLVVVEAPRQLQRVAPGNLLRDVSEAWTRHSRRGRDAAGGFFRNPGPMGDEAEQLADAAKLPWEDRFVHKFWKARVVAYEAVVKEASFSETVEGSACLTSFGTFPICLVSRAHLPGCAGRLQAVSPRASRRPKRPESPLQGAHAEG